MGRFRQHGASGLMIAVVLLLLVLALLAARVLSRMGDSAEDRRTTLVSMQRAQNALDQFVGAGGAGARLPCPADPTQDTGLEDPTPPTGNCNSAAGTLPWRTIGLRHDDAYDGWGRKLSYRVYTGNKGSLVVAGGPSMVNCTYDPAAPDTIGTGTNNGLCKVDHSTTQADFLSVSGKGLKVFDMGTEFSDATNKPVAYVVLSHGPTGLGGYTVAGVQLNNPVGDERDHTRATGPFHIEAWSDPDTAATSPQHFDDLVAYRTVRDLAFAAGLQGRKWIIPVASTTFDAATVNAALATAAANNHGSTAVVDFNGGAVTASGFVGTTATNLVLDTTNSIDPANPIEGLGVGGGFDNQISSSALESVKLVLNNGRRALAMAITLNNFGTFSDSSSGTTFTYTERVQFTFSRGNNPVGSPQTFQACNVGQGIVTFVVPVGSPFDTVVVAPLAPLSDPAAPTGDTTFAIGAFAACGGTACGTGVTTATTCP